MHASVAPAVPAGSSRHIPAPDHARLALRLFGPPALPGPPPLTEQAAAWADHVLAAAPRLPPAYVVRKALDAVAFSVEHGLREFSVPTKLVGTSRHQLAVEALALDDQRPVVARPRLTVSYTERLAVYSSRSDRSLRPLGRIQPKHIPWIAPLLDRGATVTLHRVTGLDRRARGLPSTLGLNVRISGLWTALRRSHLAAEPTVAYRVGGGETHAVRLWREADGTARMSCPHVIRHSPTGPEWGYGGSGPADCARSILLALTDEATADAHYQTFKADIVARVPKHGAVIQRSAVLAWLVGQTETPARLAA